jgi:hypothetical protein
MADIIPFGKYKNQPMEVLAQDRAYCDWLMTQGWVAERFPALHTLIINNFAAPDETPEHNALQLRFLEAALLRKVAYAVMQVQRPNEHMFKVPHYLPLLASCEAARFEERGIDVRWHAAQWVPYYGGMYNHNWHHDWRTSGLTFAIECKPSLGDDYPAVLRTLHSQGARLCGIIVERYTFVGGTLPQVRAFFHASGVSLLALPELDNWPDVPCIPEQELPPAEQYC